MSREQLVRGLLDHDDYLIIAHEHPDPDSVGSMLGLYHGLRLLGKQCKMMASDPIPSNISWPGVEDVLPFDPEVSFNAVVILDCDPHRTGSLVELGLNAALSFNVDHHQGNPGICTYNYLDPSEPAASTMVYNILVDLGVEFTPEIGQAIYGGIIGDTGGFRHANTDTRVLRIAADMVEAGADPAKTSREIFETKPWGFAQLLGHALSTMQRSSDGKIVWMSIRYQDFLKYDFDPTQSDQLVQYARMIAGVEIAILFREIAPNEVRLGFRSHQVDVGSLAREFGGGGHILASGAKMEGKIEDIEAKVLERAREIVDGELQHGRIN